MTSIDIRGESVFVQANGLRHRVLRYGKPGAHDLLLLPGITSPAVTADFLAVELAAFGFRVSVPDIRGRGESERADSGGYRLLDYVADVEGLVAGLDLSETVVIGHSMGARIAAGYAVRRHQAPGLVVLVDPPTSGPGRAPYPMSREAFLEQLGEAQRGTDAGGVRRFYPGWPDRELQLRAEVLSSCDETAVLETHAGFHTEDFHGLWRLLPAPAVLIRGGNSPVVPPDAAQELALLRPDIEIVTVAGTGHMVPWDDLAGFLAAVRPYLDQVLSQRS
jgi:N-formylmaleamate deformylase